MAGRRISQGHGPENPGAIFDSAECAADQQILAVSHIGAANMNSKGKFNVTKKMVNSGVKVLRESGALATELSADYLLVREILETSLAHLVADNNSSSAKPQEH